VITSAQNEKVKLVRELLSSKKSRHEKNLFIAEGIRMAAEALAAGSHPALTLFSQQANRDGQRIIENLRASSESIEEVSSDLLERISDTRHSQGILLVLPIPRQSSPQPADFALALDRIRDPGNMGTILRSAAAFGFETVLLTPGCADPFSPKVVRAGMGAHFKVQIIEMTAERIATFCKGSNRPHLQILLADAEEGQVCWEHDLTHPLCLIIGGEAEGASPELRAIADGVVTIPMQPQTESFNAAMSASILMYEVRRQRNTK